MTKPENNYTIGVDLSCISSPITGIGRYAVEIIPEILKLSPNVRWVFYSNSTFPEYLNLSGSLVKMRAFNLSVKGFKFLWFQFLLPFYLKSDNVDLFWSPSHRFPLFLSSKIKSVVSIHDLTYKFAPRTMQLFSRLLDNFFIPLSVKRASSIIAVSSSTAQDLLLQFPDSQDKIFTIYHGVKNRSENDLTPSPAIKNFYNSKFILFVGTLEPRKNLPRLLQAFARLPSDLVSNLKLLLVGCSGWGNISIHEIIKTHNLEDKVEILGYVSNNDLECLYSRAKFLVFPSLYEGFGLPIVEAMKYFTPSLTSNCSSMPEVAGNTALFIDPLSIESIQKGLERLLTDESLLDKLRFNCMQRHKDFQWSKAALLALNVFNGVLESEN